MYQTLINSLNFVVIAIRLIKIGEALQLQTILNLSSNFCKQLGVASHVTTEQSSWNQKIKGFVQILPPMQVYKR